MADRQGSKILEVIHRHQHEIVDEWLREAVAGGSAAREADLRSDAARILSALGSATSAEALDDVAGPQFETTRELLTDIARARMRLGATPTDTANFIFALRPVLVGRLHRAYGTDLDGLMTDTMTASRLIDQLALLTIGASVQGRDEIIGRQHQQLLDLSTPVVRLWDGILAMPLIGALDSARTQTAMDSLLQQIIETRSPIAILDITGVPMVDTMVAQHLLKTVAAARLIGADCIVSGVRPQIAQTIVQLGIDLRDVITKATLAEAFAVALQRTGRSIRRIDS